jgi:hypothetical protein
MVLLFAMVLDASINGVAWNLFENLLHEVLNKSLAALHYCHLRNNLLRFPRFLSAKPACKLFAYEEHATL